MAVRHYIFSDKASDIRIGGIAVNKEIALALGGGGIRGIAHIGVIRCLEEHGFKVRAVVGTSAGGLVGSVYAAGYSIEAIAQAARDLAMHPSFKRSPDDKPSLLGAASVTKLLIEMLGEQNIEEFPIPFVATAVSVKSGEEFLLNKGSAVNAVLSTIAIPGILPIQEINGVTLMDGGVLDPVPVKAARWLNPKLPIVAVVLHDKSIEAMPDRIPLPLPEVLPYPIKEQLSKLRIVEAIKIFSRSVEVCTQRLSELNLMLDKPDVIIRPKVGHFNLFGKVNPDELIQKGYEATMPMIAQLMRACGLYKTFVRALKFRDFQKTAPNGWRFLSS